MERFPPARPGRRRPGRSLPARLPRRALAALLAVGLLAPGCARRVAVAAAQEPPAASPATAAPVFPGERWERIAVPESVGYSSEGLRRALDRLRELETTGFVVVVGGRILLQYGDIEELSYIASVRKSVLAMLYGNYVADGTIDLDLTLEELGFTDHGGLLPIERRATIRHLLTARSGIYHPASNPGDNSADAPPRGSKEPGTYMLYNNWDFNAAGAIFERLTGRDIYDAVTTDLAVPIGMQDWDRSRQRKSGDLERSMYPAYHMWFSTRDMARLGYLMLREGKWNGRQVIPREWVRTITGVVTPVEEMNPPRRRRGPFGYGYMWWVFDGVPPGSPYEGAYQASGAYGQYILVLPRLDMVIAHKTAVPPRRRTSLAEFHGVVDLIVGARCDGPCP